MIMTMIYGTVSSEVRHILLPYDSEVWRGWGEYLRIALPASALTFIEQITIYTLAILASLLGVVELASYTIGTYVITLTNTVAVGTQQATCVLIGNSIGANNVLLAK